MNENNQKIILSEEKVFGNEFVIIRRKYAPESGDNRRNLFKEYIENKIK